jgi:hypothetical protein
MSLYTECVADNAGAYFKLDEIIGSTPAAALDSLGLGFTNINYQGNIVTGQLPLAYNDINSKSPLFDGVNDNITMTTPGSYTDNFTVEVWAKFNSFTNEPCLWSGWNANSSGNYGSGIYVNNSGVIQVELARNTWNIMEVQASTAVTLQLGVTYHIALTTDNTAKSAKLYINGVQQWSYTYANNVGLFNNAKTFRIGSRGSNNWMQGYLDELVIYYGAGIAPVPQARIAVHYAAGVITSIAPTVTSIQSNGKSVITNVISEMPGTPNILRPYADNTADYSRVAGQGWTYTSTTGQPHYRAVDEVTLDTTDYIQYSGTHNDLTYWFVRQDLTAAPYDPLTGKGHIARFAYKGNWAYSNTGSQPWVFIDIRQLRPGMSSLFIATVNTSSLSTSRPYTDTTGDPTTQTDGDVIIVEKELTEAEADLITDYTRLVFVMYLYNGSGSAVSGRDMRWYWMELETPEWAGIGGLSEITNTNVNGQSVTITTTSNVEILQEETSIHTLCPGFTTVIAETPITVNAIVSNTAVNGQNVDILIDNSIAIESSPNQINIIGHNISVISGDSFLTTPEEGVISLDAKDAQVITNSILSATTASISLDAKNTSSKYYDTVVQHAPVHWWRMNDHGNWAYDANYQATITDSGSSPVNGTSNIPDAGSFQAPIPGAWSNNGFESLLTEVYSNTVIRFSSKPISNSDNLTLEFWVKWGSVAFTEPYILANNVFNVGTTTEAYTGIGIVNGALAYTRDYKIGGVFYNQTTTVTGALARNTWHHIVLTKSTTGGTSTYRSYVDGQVTSTPVSIGDWFYYGNDIDYQSIVGRVTSSNAANNTFSRGQLWIDEVAVYETALSANEIQQHFSAGTLGPLNATISAEVTNIEFFCPLLGVGTQINPNSSNINIQLRNPIVDAGGGSPLIITNAPNIVIDGKDTTPTGVADAVVVIQRTTIDVNGTSAKISTRESEFNFISKSDNSLSAADAEEIANINFGGLLFNQIKKEMFKIGNLSDYISRFEIFAYSADQDVSSAVSLSKDNITYSSSIVFEEILPNQITDNIYIKFDVNELQELGIGTFLIRVEQTDVS